MCLSLFWFIKRTPKKLKLKIGLRGIKNTVECTSIGGDED